MAEEKSILVVDDDDATCKLLEKILSSEGYRVLTASNGLEGLNMVTLYKPDLIILDMRMPIADGWKFLDIYCEEAPPRIPVIAISAEPSSFKMLKCANEFLAKPYSLVELLNCVQKYVNPEVYFGGARTVS